MYERFEIFLLILWIIKLIIMHFFAFSNNRAKMSFSLLSDQRCGSGNTRRGFSLPSEGTSPTRGSFPASPATRVPKYTPFQTRFVIASLTTTHRRPVVAVAGGPIGFGLIFLWARCLFVYVQQRTCANPREIAARRGDRVGYRTRAHGLELAIDAARTARNDQTTDALRKALVASQLVRVRYPGIDGR